MLSSVMDTALWSDWGLGGLCWAESKGGERAQIPEVGMAKLSGLVIWGVMHNRLRCLGTVVCSGSCMESLSYTRGGVLFVPC